jgi:EmrB/QacA subfamily drug resistance transporter
MAQSIPGESENWTDSPPAGSAEPGSPDSRSTEPGSWTDQGRARHVSGSHLTSAASQETVRHFRPPPNPAQVYQAPAYQAQAYPAQAHQAPAYPGPTGLAPAYPAQAEPDPGQHKAGPIVAVLAIAVFMASLDLFIVNLAFPYIGREFAGTTLSTLSWVLNGYTVVFAAVLVPAGRWADRIGRRRVFMAGLIAFGIGSLLCGVAPSVPALIAARVIQAIGSGLMVPASLSLLLAAVPAHGRTAAIGTWSAFSAMGAALGPVVGGGLVQLNWRWVFLINIPIGLLALALAAKKVPESKDENATRRPDLIGAALLAACVGLVALALVKAPDWGWGSARFLGTMAIAIACGTAIVLRSRTHHSPVIELALLRSRTFSGAFLTSLVFYAAFGAFILNFVEFLTGVWHYSAVQAGLAIAPGPLMVLPAAKLVAPLAAKFGGPGRVAVLGCFVLVTAMVLWYFRIQAVPAYVTHLLPCQILGGVGVGFTIPAVLGAGSASLPPDRFGTGSGILNMARQIGIVLGVAALVAVLARVELTDPLATFRACLALIIALFVGSGLIAAVMLAARPAIAATGLVAAPATAASPGTEP